MKKCENFEKSNKFHKSENLKTAKKIGGIKKNWKNIKIEKILRTIEKMKRQTDPELQKKCWI